MENNQIPWALITGANGGIGKALVRAFDLGGYAVIGTDLSPPPADLPCKHFIKADLQQTVNDEVYAEELFAEIRKRLNGGPLKVLVNNAAIQMLGKVENLTRKDWRATLDINLLAPFFLGQALLPELEEARGSVINISSIHARLTKRDFAAYATSKAALSGLTRSLALEMGDRIRVNAIEPAAVDTDMLKAGFEGKPDGFSQLERYHPTPSIGKPEEIGLLALMLAGGELPFMNGVTIPLDGGIGGCLHDPS
jgi:NAD(P)-dependent dehydrogenase (short-subunit alcohol dehydrogenase family)